CLVDCHDSVPRLNSTTQHSPAGIFLVIRDSAIVVDFEPGFSPAIVSMEDADRHDDLVPRSMFSRNHRLDVVRSSDCGARFAGAATSLRRGKNQIACRVLFTVISAPAA